MKWLLIAWTCVLLPDAGSAADGAPIFEMQGEQIVVRAAMTYYGRWTYKYEEGVRRGGRAHRS